MIMSLNLKHNDAVRICSIENSQWKTNSERARAIKDAFFAQDWQSPISPQDKPSFKGLEYYPPNSIYRFEIDLNEHLEKQVVKMSYTKGNEQAFLRWGEFRFKLGRRYQTLQAYKNGSHEEMLFVPFKDTTSGKETYGAGRYLDLVPERDRTAEGKWILDFNQAYNPWCMYSEAYTCPFVPIENWLDIPIFAGEKNYPLRRGKS